MADVVADLQEAESELAKARAHADSAALGVDRARSLVAHALDGSSPGELLALVDKVRDALRFVVQDIEPAREGLASTVAEAGTLARGVDAMSDIELMEQPPQTRLSLAGPAVLLGSFMVGIGCAVAGVFLHGKLSAAAYLTAGIVNAAGANIGKRRWEKEKARCDSARTSAAEP